MQVNEKTRLRVSAELRPEIAEAFRIARKALGFTQTELAKALGASQGAVTRWERAIDSPPISAITMMAAMVPDDQKSFWREAGAITPASAPEAGDVRHIPVLRDAAAAGTPRAVQETEIDYMFPMPKKLLPVGGKLYGLIVDGDSMSPVLETGYLAIVDVSSKRPDQLAGRMVAARDGEGVTIKWLQKQTNDLYLLVPNNKDSPRHRIQIMQPEGEWSIVGQVVTWLGFPPMVRK